MHIVTAVHLRYPPLHLSPTIRAFTPVFNGLWGESRPCLMHHPASIELRF